MSFLALLPTLFSVLGYVPQIGSLISQVVSAWNQAPNNGIAAVGKVLQTNPQAVNILTQVGAAWFPKLSPEIHAIAAALVIGHPDNTVFAQQALNLAQSVGYISFGSALVVDGIWGPKTMAAVEAIETKLGLPATGFLNDIAYNALSALVAKM